MSGPTGRKSARSSPATVMRRRWGCTSSTATTDVTKVRYGVAVAAVAAVVSDMGGAPSEWSTGGPLASVG